MYDSVQEEVIKKSLKKLSSCCSQIWSFNIENKIAFKLRPVRPTQRAHKKFERRFFFISFVDFCNQCGLLCSHCNAVLGSRQAANCFFNRQCAGGIALRIRETGVALRWSQYLERFRERNNENACIYFTTPPRQAFQQIRLNAFHFSAEKYRLVLVCKV